VKTSIPRLRSFTPKSTGNKIEVIQPNNSQKLQLHIGDFAVVTIENLHESGKLRNDTACYILDAAKRKVMFGDDD